MARPLRAIYANVAVTFSQSNVSTVSDAITFGSHSFVNGAIVVYSSTSPIGGLTNNATYYVKNTTATTIQLATTSSGTPIDFLTSAAATDTLTQVVTTGVREMSDADLQDWVVPLIVNYWLNYPNSCPGTQLAFNNPSSNTVIRGSALDTARVLLNNTTASLNDHPVVSNTVATHSLYQTQTSGGTTRSAILTARPVYYGSPSSTLFKEMSDSELNDHFWPAFFSAADLEAGGKASWYLSSTAPVATGTWTEKSSITDTYVTTGAPITTTYRLYQRTDQYSVNPSIFHIRPLYYDTTTGGLREMTDSHIESLATYFYEYITATGIGQYSFLSSTPTPGTWVSLGSYVNKLNNTSDTAYTGYFANSFTGAFTGTYTGAFTGQYGNSFTGAFTGPYVGSFSGLFSGAYSQQFTGAFSGNYAGSYVNAFTNFFTNVFAGTYQSTFTGLYSGSFTGQFSGLYTQLFTGTYSGSYQQTFTGAYNQAFAGTYVGLYGGTAYAGAYTGFYVVYYGGTTEVGYFAGTYGSNFVNTTGSGLETYQVSGAYRGLYTVTVFYGGTPGNVSYIGFYTPPAYTGLGLPRAYAGGYAGAYGGNTIYYGGAPTTGVYYFTGVYTGLFIANAKGYGTAQYTGAPYGASYTGIVFYGGSPGNVGYAGMYQASWTGVKLDNRMFGVYATFISNFTGSYTSTYSGGYVGTFTGTYSGAYAGSFTGIYNQSFSRLFTGLYTGSFTGAYTGIFNQSFSRFFSGAYTGAYSQAFTGAFTGAYAGSFSSFFSGAYTKAFTQGFTGVYNQAFTGIYNRAFTGAFSGAYTGLTVINTTTDTTTSLWIRSA